MLVCLREQTVLLQPALHSFSRSLSLSHTHTHRQSVSLFVSQLSVLIDCPSKKKKKTPFKNGFYEHLHVNALLNILKSLPLSLSLCHLVTFFSLSFSMDFNTDVYSTFSLFFPSLTLLPRPVGFFSSFMGNTHTHTHTHTHPKITLCSHLHPLSLYPEKYNRGELLSI